MNTSGILVYNISDCLQTAADLFDWTKKRKAYNIVENFEEILNGNGLHVLADDINSVLFFVYLCICVSPREKKSRTYTKKNWIRKIASKQNHLNCGISG